MIFKGYGSVYDGAKKKMIVNFRKTPEYETTDAREIELIIASGYTSEKQVEVSEIKPIIIEEIPEEINEDKPLTKKQVMDSLDASSIDYNPRDKKEVLLKLLEG